MSTSSVSVSFSKHSSITLVQGQTTTLSGLLGQTATVRNNTKGDIHVAYGADFQSQTTSRLNKNESVPPNQITTNGIVTFVFDVDAADFPGLTITTC